MRTTGAVVGVVLMRTCFELRERGKLGCIEHGTLAPCTKARGSEHVLVNTYGM